MGYFACSIDIGTSGARLYGYDDAFESRLLYSRPTGLIIEGDSVEQDAGLLAASFREALDTAIDKGCRSIGVSLYRGSVVAWRGLDPLSRVITWMDRRPGLTRLPLTARIASRLPLLSTILSPGSPALSLRLLYTRYMEQLRGGAMTWTLDSFLIYMLTGRFLSDVSQAALTGLINPYNLKPMGIVKAVLGMRGLRTPEIIGHGEPVAVYKGRPVGPFISDQQAASIGLGCTSRGCMKATLGTGVFIDAPTGGPPRVFRRDVVPLILAALPGEVLYGVEGFAGGVGIVFDAFSRVLGGFGEIERLARAATRHTIVVPAIAGTRTPYKPFLRGAVLGVSPGFDRASMARGLVAGGALLFHTIYRIIRSVAGRPGRLVIGGGLSRLRVLTEAIAGLVDVEVYKSIDYNDSARGAALLAAYANGDISRRELLGYTPRVLEVEPLDLGLEGGVEAWPKVLDVLGSKSLLKALEEILA
ncbi:MAG: hypothetical protein GSR86_06645 [Desulfurococcales archaeon]|nr:hypothetical protein [Desulfurococcales archaeon]